MMTKDADKKREQMMIFCMDDMVPKGHMLRKIDKAILIMVVQVWTL